MANYNEEHSLLLSNGEHIQEVNLDERDNHRGDGHNGCQCHEVLLNSTSEVSFFFARWLYLMCTMKDKKGAEKLLLVLAAFCFAFIIAQFIGGIFAHSIAIVMDSARIINLLFLFTKLIYVQICSPICFQLLFPFWCYEFHGSHRITPILMAIFEPNL